MKIYNTNLFFRLSFVNNRIRMPSDAKKQRDKAKKEKEKLASKQKGGGKKQANSQKPEEDGNDEEFNGNDVQNGDFVEQQELDAVMDVLHKVELDNAKARAVAGVLTSQPRSINLKIG